MGDRVIRGADRAGDARPATGFLSDTAERPRQEYEQLDRCIASGVDRAGSVEEVHAFREAFGAEGPEILRTERV